MQMGMHDSHNVLRGKYVASEVKFTKKEKKVEQTKEKIKQL